MNPDLHIRQGSQGSVKSGSYQGIWKIPSFLQKVRELSGNLGLHQGFPLQSEFSEMNLPLLCLSMTHGNVLHILTGYGSHSPWISLGNGCLLNHWVCESSWIYLYLVKIRIMPKVFSPSWIKCEKIFKARNFCLVKFQNVI